MSIEQLYRNKHTQRYNTEQDMVPATMKFIFLRGRGNNKL